MISIVIATRNDDHGGNQLGRLRAFVRGLDDWRAALDWDIELIIVEWNPPNDRPMLDEVLDRRDWVRLLRVPASVHQRYDNADAVPIFFHIGTNVGVRRARGDWILTTSQDIILSEPLARFLAHGNLCERAFYRTTRMNSSEREVPDAPVRDVLALLSANIGSVRSFHPKKALHTRACGDFILMHRDAWYALRGYPEFELFGTFLDGLVIHAAYASEMIQVALDPTRCIYHIDHSAGTHAQINARTMPHLDYGTEYSIFCMEMLRENAPLIVNYTDWGLADDDAVINVW